MEHTTIPAPDAYRRRLSEMLDLTYELEGLLHIGVSRSSVPPHLNQLIVNKLNAIVSLADDPAEESEYHRLKEAYKEDLKEEAAKEAAENEDAAEYDEESEEAPAVEANEEPAEENIKEKHQEDIESKESAPEEKKEVKKEEIKDKKEEIKEEIVEEKIIEKSAPTNKAPQQSGRLFSVNDRFLYARELFGGNLKKFDAAIDGVITLDNYDEAEEYFVSEWGIDPESPTGMRFLATISKMY